MMNLLQELFKVNNRKPIIVVSGLPRSGTSMMMQILEAGGIEPVTDNKRRPDANNSKGYYEHAGVKALAKGQHSCLANAKGKAIKVISSLLKYLPSDRHYKVIFMRRDMNEILASQAAMLKNLNKINTSDTTDDQLKPLYLTHLDHTLEWLETRDNIDMLLVDYAATLNAPVANIDQLSEFIDANLHKKAMLSCIDQSMRHHTST